LSETTFVAESIHTKKLSIADFLQVKYNFKRKTPVLHFSPFGGGLGPTYDVYLRLILKPLVDFLLVIELFR